MEKERVIAKTKTLNHRKSLSPLLSAVILLALTVSIAFVASSSISSLTQRQTETSTKYSARCLGGNLEIGKVFYEKTRTWWNASWRYRRPVLIRENSGNSLRDYQIPINITHNTRMQSDFSDLRFTWLNEANRTEIKIPYWIEDKVNGEYAYVWIKVPHIPANQNSTVYMYYGNTTPVESEEDKKSTFLYSTIYGGSDDEEFYALCSDGDYIYAAGYTRSEGSGNADALIVKLPKSLGAKQYEPATLTYQNSNLTYQNSNLNYTDSNLNYTDSSLTYQNSNLNYQDSNLTVTDNYLRAYVSPEPASSISREKLSLILKNSFNVNLTSLHAMIKTSRGNYYRQTINLESDPITPGELREVEIDLSPLQSGEIPEKIIISPKECPVSVEREIG